MNKKQNVLKYLLLIELKGGYKQCSIKASQIFRKKNKKKDYKDYSSFEICNYKF